MENDYLEDLELKVLSLIDEDIERNPSNVFPVDVEYWKKLKKLTEGVEVDINAPITDDMVFTLCQIAKTEVQEGKGLTVEDTLEKLRENRKKVIDNDDYLC